VTPAEGIRPGVWLDPETSLVAAVPEQLARLGVRVVNRAPAGLGGGDVGFELSYHLLDASGRRIPSDNPRVPIEPDLEPGAERDLQLPIAAPVQPGEYFCELDILWAGVTWLSSLGNPTAIIGLSVSPDHGQPRWRLSVQEGNSAQLVPLMDPPGGLRVAITQAQTESLWDIQLNRSSVPVKAGERYSVRWRARSDRERSAGIGFARNAAPWNNLGWYEAISLTSEWREFSIEFTATETEENTRVHVDLGGSRASVELGLFQVGTQVAPLGFEPPPFASAGRRQMHLGPRALSERWGTDRGMPVHRHYVEQFLGRHRGDIRGRCLEFQEPTYIPRFGGSAVARLDILHQDASNPLATLVADLTRTNTLADCLFDCIVCTHVLQLIPEVERAIAELHRILAPGGVLLIAEPHVSMCGSEYREIWRFTPLGLETLLARHFPAENLAVEGYGNSLTAAGELRGVVTGEFTPAELAAADPRFAVEVCARAVKAG
jgi:SAM-dependent methyltransferase